MTKSVLAALLVAGGVCAAGQFVSIAQAGTIIPYPNVGTVNSEVYTFTATATGEIDAYFYGASAADTEVVGLLVNGVSTGVTGLNNHTSSVGDSVNLGGVTAGDILTFVDYISSGPTWYSKNALNSDGISHVYSAPYPASGALGSAYNLSSLIPAGTFVAFEDTALSSSDLDYNDVQFVFTNVSTSTTPLPAALPLFATGLGALGLLGWRRKRKTAVIGA